MKKIITNKQISFILYCITIGYGVINLPQNVAKSGETGGWIGISIAGIIFIGIVYMMTYLQYKNENKTIYEYSEKLVGKFFTYVFVIIYMINFFLWFTLITRLYCENLHLTILLNTPVRSMSILFYIVIDYIIIKGLNSIASLCEIYGTINIIFLIIFIFILFGEGNSVNIMPIFAKEDIPNYIRSIGEGIIPFIGVEILVLIPISKTNNKNVFKYTTGIIAIITILYVFIIEAAISVVGIDSIVSMKSSLFNITKGLDVEYLELFRRFDGIYFFVWTLNIVCSVSLSGYGAFILFSKILKTIKFNYIVICGSIISFMLGSSLKTSQSVDLAVNYLSYAGGICYFIIPFILTIITRVKSNDKNI